MMGSFCAAELESFLVYFSVIVSVKVVEYFHPKIALLSELLSDLSSRGKILANQWII